MSLFSTRPKFRQSGYFTLLSFLCIVISLVLIHASSTFAPLQTITVDSITLGVPQTRSSSIVFSFRSNQVIDYPYAQMVISTLDPCREALSTPKSVKIPLLPSPSPSNSYYIYESTSDSWSSLLDTITRCAISRVVLQVLALDGPESSSATTLGTTIYSAPTNGKPYIVPSVNILSRSCVTSIPTPQLLATYTQQNTSVTYYTPTNQDFNVQIAFESWHFLTDDVVEAVNVTATQPNDSLTCTLRNIPVISTPYSANNPNKSTFLVLVSKNAIYSACGTPSSLTPQWGFTLSWALPSNYSTDPDWSGYFAVANSMTVPTTTAPFSQIMGVTNTLTGEDVMQHGLPMTVPVPGNILTQYITLYNPSEIPQAVTSAQLTCKTTFTLIDASSPTALIKVGDIGTMQMTITLDNTTKSDIQPQYLGKTTPVPDSLLPFLSYWNIAKNVSAPRLVAWVGQCWSITPQWGAVYNQQFSFTSDGGVDVIPQPAAQYATLSSSIVNNQNPRLLLDVYTIHRDTPIQAAITISGTYDTRQMQGKSTSTSFSVVWNLLYSFPALSDTDESQYYYRIQNISIPYQEIKSLINAGVNSNGNQVLSLYDIVISIDSSNGTIPAVTTLESSPNINLLFCAADDICGTNSVVVRNTDNTCATECICDIGYFGISCEMDETCRTAYNSLRQCNNRGSLLSTNGTCNTSCTCRDSSKWGGKSCDENINCTAAKNDFETYTTCPAGQITHTQTNSVTGYCKASCGCTTTQCSNHGVYTVNTTTNQCTTTCACNDGWTGATCNRDIDCEGYYTALNQCNGRGIVTKGTNGTCQQQCTCQGSWFGDCSETTDCAEAKAAFEASTPCPSGQSTFLTTNPDTEVCSPHCGCSSPTICSGHGHQVVDANGQCVSTCLCDPLWFESDCSRYSPCEDQYIAQKNCNGHGTVNYLADGKTCSSVCTCTGEWYGDDCSLTTNCNDAIIQFGGTTVCTSVSGRDIHTDIDPDTGQCDVSCVCKSSTICSGHGIQRLNQSQQCINGCECDDGWQGQKCEQTDICEDVYNSLNKCNNVGYVELLVPNSTSSNDCNTVCTCDPTQTIWSGDACAQTSQCHQAINLFTTPTNPCLTGPSNQIIYLTFDDDGYCVPDCGCEGTSICNGSGTAPVVIDPKTGNKMCSLDTCICDSGFTGPTCQQSSTCQTQYDQLNQCSNHGIVQQINGNQCDTKCTCDETRLGNDCSLTTDCDIALEEFSGCGPNEGVYPEVDPDTGICTAKCGCATSGMCNDHGVQPYLPDNKTCSGKCICDDSNEWTGDVCQHNVKCIDTIEVLDECNGRGTVVYDPLTQTCQTICTCDDTTQWDGITCAQSQICKPKNNINCGSYGYIQEHKVEDNTTIPASCDNTCTCLFDFIGSLCAECPIQCYNTSPLNMSIICRDDIPTRSPCACREHSSGRYCQYYSVTTSITYRNKQLPQWLIDSITNKKVMNPESDAFIKDYIHGINTLLGYTNSSTLTNTGNPTLSLIYNKEVIDRTIVPFSSMSVYTTPCQQQQNNGSSTIVNIPTSFSAVITTYVGTSIESSRREAQELQSKWNIITTQSGTILVTTSNNIFAKHSILPFNYIDNKCDGNNNDNDIDVDITPDKTLDDDESSPGEDSSNDCYILSYYNNIYIIMIISIILSIIV